MDIASVMAIVDGEANDRAVFRTAIDAGRTLNAVTAMFQISPPQNEVVYPAPELASSRLVENLISGINEEIASRRARFEDSYRELVVNAGLPTLVPGDLTNAPGFAVTKYLINGHENKEIARRGRLFDLIIVGPPDEAAGGIDSAALEAALLDTGRPVLISCPDPKPLRGQNVTIAWDGSREAGLSVRNALPLLRHAHNIEVVQVLTGGNTDVHPLDASKYLLLHDIESLPRQVEVGDRTISETLLKAAKDNGNAILVMGAYGQTAMTEFMFGGVTRDVMQNTEAPLFLCH